MGNIWSFLPWTTDCKIGIDDKDINRLWAYNSTTGARYVCMFPYHDDSGDDSQTYVVKAIAEVEVNEPGGKQPLTKITFHQTESPIERFILKFHDGTAAYEISASVNGVTASENPSSTTAFEVKPLYPPNQPYFWLQSKQKQGEEALYLSSDGAGNMKLKVWNKPVPGPPDTTENVDPAFLFRVVTPREV